MAPGSFIAPTVAVAARRMSHGDGLATQEAHPRCRGYCGASRRHACSFHSVSDTALRLSDALIGGVNMLVDISERKLAEKTLAERNPSSPSRERSAWSELLPTTWSRGKCKCRRAMPPFIWFVRGSISDLTRRMAGSRTLRMTCPTRRASAACHSRGTQRALLRVSHPSRRHRGAMDRVA